MKNHIESEHVQVRNKFLLLKSDFCGNQSHAVCLLQVTCKCRMKIEKCFLKDHEVGGLYMIRHLADTLLY